MELVFFLSHIFSYATLAFLEKIHIARYHIYFSGFSFPLQLISPQCRQDS